MTVYEYLGEEEGIQRLVDRFYELMDTLPEAKTIRAMHPKDLTESRQKLTWFLVGRFGGPNKYVENYGHPRLRMRHMPFAIDEKGATAWMICMGQAMMELLPEDPIRDEIYVFFAQIAHFMQNR